MTISSTNRKAGPYAGNDVAVAFPFSFKVFSASDLYVVRADSTGAETPLTLTTDYTVSLNSNQDSNPGGTITLPAALASIYTLTIASQLENLQPTDLTNQGGFYPKVITNALDRLTILVQQLAESVSRSLKTAISTPDGVSSQLPKPVAGNLLGWSTDGTAISNFAAQTGTSLVDLAAPNGSTLIGFINGAAGTVKRSVQDKLKDTVSIKDFGAVGDGVADDSTAFNSAVSYLNSLGGGCLYMPRGIYKLSNCQIPYSYISIKGCGTNATTILNPSTNTPSIKWGDGTNQYYGGGISGVRFGSASGVVGVSGQYGFVFSKVGQFFVEDVWCQSFPAALFNGCQFSACSQFTVNNLQVQNCLGAGIKFTSSLDCYVTDCRSDGNVGSGWQIDNTQGGYFKSCTGYNNTQNAFKLSSSSPSTAPNYNNFFIGCIGDTSGSYNWNIGDSKNSYFIGCWGATQQSTVVNTTASGFFISTQYSQDLFFTGCSAINNNSHGFIVYDPGSSAPQNIHFENCQYGSTSNGANGNGKSGAGSGLAITGAADHIRVRGGAFYGNATSAVSNTSSGTDIIVSGNPVGCATVTNGVGGIAGGTTTQTVTHGLGMTPNLAGISVVETSNAAPSGTTSVWITSVTSTQFTINLNANMSGFNYAWRAALPGN